MHHPDRLGDVRKFHIAFGHHVADTPTIPNNPELYALRKNLIKSEWEEFLHAWETNDLVEMADALADLDYVIEGTALAFGIPLDTVWRAVQESNMNKLWTTIEIQSLFMPRPAGVPDQLMFSPEYLKPEHQGWTFRRSPIADRSLLVDADYRQWAVSDKTGKVRKPPGWQAPDIAGILADAIERPLVPTPAEVAHAHHTDSDMPLIP
jgi:hypothetical protein